MNISFRQLKAFLQVARLGNFTRAAEQLHVTQAGLSIMMRELESQLNCRLFDRTTRNVTLTLAGERLLPVAQRTMADLENIAAQLNEISTRAKQNLIVGATPLVSSSVLPAVWQAFRQSHPQVAVRLIDAHPVQLQAMVERGEIDMGLGAFFKPTAGLEVAQLFEFQLMWITASSASPPPPDEERHVGTLPWSALHDAQLISLPPEHPIQQVIETHLAGIGRAHEERQTFNSFDTLIAMVAAGAGSTIIPSYANAVCRQYRARAAVLVEPEVSLGFYRITKRGRGRPEAMVEFTDAFVAQMRRLMPLCV